jgi:hypothetical protein
MASNSLATTKKAAPRSTSKEITQADYVVTDVPTLAQFTEAVQEGVKLVYEGSEQTDNFLADTLTSATSTADLFGGASELLKVEEVLGTVLTLTGIDAVRNSDFEDGMGIYLIVSAVDPEGEAVKLAVGNKSGIGVILGIHENDDFPWKVSFERSSKPTKRGFFPINIVNRQVVDKNGKKVDF